MEQEENIKSPEELEAELGLTIHASDCAVWVGEPCDCILGEL